METRGNAANRGLGGFLRCLALGLAWLVCLRVAKSVGCCCSSISLLIAWHGLVRFCGCPLGSHSAPSPCSEVFVFASQLFRSIRLVTLRRRRWQASLRPCVRPPCSVMVVRSPHPPKSWHSCLVVAPPVLYSYLAGRASPTALLSFPSSPFTITITIIALRYDPLIAIPPKSTSSSNSSSASSRLSSRLLYSP